MRLTTETIQNLLVDHNLLLDAPDVDMTFDFLHYDTREVQKNTLFVIKGAFKRAYLDNVHGITGLITETKIDVDLPQWQVTNVQKALSLLSMAFFDYPQERLWIGAFTGTKGKTTAAYFAYT
ncbi:MAG TPA: UDP-N-acetylmuramyl peptide synthase, partial [Leuconostoc mesenteroides]|nr:UDP-N-acetylmuramyl peptide synthase [Leuconostoc mesenteroides]